MTALIYKNQHVELKFSKSSFSLRMQINFVVAVDFTASNGKCNHFKNCLVFYCMVCITFRHLMDWIKILGISFIELNVDRIFVDGIFEWKFNTILDLTRSSCEKYNFRSSDRNRTCGPAIPVQRSDQLRYRETVVELYHRFLYFEYKVMSVLGI